MEEPDNKQSDGHGKTPRALRNSADYEYESLLSQFQNTAGLGDVKQEPATPDQMARNENLRRAYEAHTRVLAQRELGLKMAAINGRALNTVLPRGISVKKEPAENMSISSSSASERTMDTSELSPTGSRHVTFEDQVRDGNVPFDLPGVTYLPDPADHKEKPQQDPSASIEDIQDNIVDSIKITKSRGRVRVTVKDSGNVANQPGAGTSGTTTNKGDDFPGTSAGTGRPLLFDDLTLSDTKSEEQASQPDKKQEEGDPEGERDNGGARH